MKLFGFIFLFLFLRNVANCNDMDGIFAFFTLVDLVYNAKTRPIDEAFCPAERMSLRKPAVPGSILVCYGLNLFKYDPIPAEISAASKANAVNALKKSRGVSERLFEMKCSDLESTWTMKAENRHGFSNNHPNFVIPDFLISVDSTQLASSIEDMNHCHSFMEITQSLQGKMEIESDLGFLGGSSLSASYQEKIKTLNETDVRTLEVREIKEMVKLMSRNNVALRKYVTTKFEESWKNLPDEYDDDQEKYNEFLEMFGTHYFNRATIGSFHYMKSVTRQEFLSKHSESTLKECGKVRVLNKEFNSESSQVTKEQYDEFLESSTFTSEVYATLGGLEDDPHERWHGYWPTFPWITSGNIAPTYGLIKDSKISENVRLALVVKQMQTFIETYQTEIDVIIDFYGADRIDHEGYFKSIVAWVGDDNWPSDLGKCDENIPNHVKKMICCQGGSSVKRTVQAFEAIKSVSNSPTLRRKLIEEEELMQRIKNFAEIVQANLWGVKDRCVRAVRRNT